MDHAAEPKSTPAKVANLATAAHSMAGADLRLAIVKRVATLPLVHAVAALLRLRYRQHRRLQLHPQPPPGQYPPMQLAVPTTVAQLAWAVRLATVAAAPDGVVKQTTTAADLVNQDLATVVVTTHRVQAQ